MWRRGEPSLLLLACVLAACAAVAHGNAALQLGVISSATGSLTDWNDTVKGYQFALQYLLQKNPSGIPVTDSHRNTYYVPVTLNVLDDGSNATVHTQLLNQLLAPGGSDVIMNANPSFAAEEAVTVNTANKVNLHAITANTDVFTSLAGVFGMVPTSAGFTTALFQAYRVSTIKKVAVLLRSDNEELKAACSAAELNAKQYLITYTEIAFTAADNLTAIANAVNASGADALCACVTSTDASTIYRRLDALRMPLKNIFFTNGPQRPAWNAALGDLSTYLTTPAFWASTLSGSTYTDIVFGTAQDFQNKYSAWPGAAGNAPTDYAAAAAAATSVLWTAFSAAFVDCDLTVPQGNAGQLLYNTTALRCSDNLNDGIRRLSRTIQQLSMTTFFGSIGFNKQGQNYAGSISLAQVFSVTQDLKQAYVPQVVAPISAAVKSLVLPQKNRYAPVCPPGSYQNPDDYQPCIPCSTGQFQNLQGQDHCEICSKNSYSNTTGQVSCSQCPLNTVTSERGAVAPTDCVCQVGYYNAFGTGGYACLACPDNADCAGGTDVPRPQSGWYAERDAPFTMYNCNPNLVCEGNFSCAAGYTGRMCSYCDTANGYFMALSRCYVCPSNGLIVLFMALMMLLFILLNTGVTRQIETFLVLVNFCQLLSLINGFNANWPNAISNLMNFASVLAFEPDCIQPQCLDKEWSFEQNLMFQLLMPLIIAGFTLLWIGFTYCCYLGKRWLESTSEDDPSIDTSMSISFSMSSRVISRSATGDEGTLFGRRSSGGGKDKTEGMGSLGSLQKTAFSNWLLVMQALVTIPSHKAEMVEVVFDRLSIPLMFLNSSYMATLKYCLSAFYCHDFAGTKYMYYMTKEQCYSPKHYEVMLIAMAGLVVYCVGLWAMVIQVLSHLKKTRSFGDKVPLLLFGWIYDMFNIRYYWFEVVSMFHRTAMTVIMVFMLDYTDVQLLIAFIITGAVLIIQVRTAAISDIKARTMDTVGDALLLVVIVIGLMLNNPVTLPSTADGLNNTLMAIVIGYLCASGIVIAIEVVFIVYTSILMSRHSDIAKKWGHKIKRFKHMYKVFTPSFMIKWLTKARAVEWQEWHRLGLFLADYVHPTSETSYLSDRKVGRFWRFLLSNFPEVLDYLATVNANQREHFNRFIETMYIDFFDSADEHSHQLNHIVNEDYRAPVAQWLSQASEDEVGFLKTAIQHAYESVKGKQAGMQLHRAMSRFSDAGAPPCSNNPGKGPSASWARNRSSLLISADTMASAPLSPALSGLHRKTSAVTPRRAKFAAPTGGADDEDSSGKITTETVNVQGASDEEDDGLTVLGDSPENTLRPPSPRLMSVTQPRSRPGTSPFANGGVVDLMVQASVEDPSKGDVVQQQGMVQQGMVQQQQGVAQPSRPASAVSSKASPSPLRPSSSQPEISEGAVEAAGEDVAEQLPSQPLPIPMHLHSLRVRRPSGASNPGSRPATPQAPLVPPPAAPQAAAAPSRPMTPSTSPGLAPAPAPAQMEDILSDLVQDFNQQPDEAAAQPEAHPHAIDSILQDLEDDAAKGRQ